MSNFFTAAWKRLQGETPVFFKKIRTIGNSLMVTGTACTATNIATSIKMPPVLVELGTHAIVAGFIMTTVASFACKDPNDIPPKS